MKFVWNTFIILSLLTNVLFQSIHISTKPSAPTSLQYSLKEANISQAEDDPSTEPSLEPEEMTEEETPQPTPEGMPIEPVDDSTGITPIVAIEINEIGGKLSSPDETIEIEIPEKALNQPATLALGLPDPAGFPWTPSGHPFEVLAIKNNAGLIKVNERNSFKKSDLIKKFEKPIPIKVKYDPRFLVGDEASLNLYYYDESLQTWQALPSEVDRKNHVLTGYTTHFSVFDYSTSDYQAAMLPSMNQAQVASFTGAATYEYPIRVPEGPAGLTPSLTLRYNSQVVDDASDRTQASWVGMGWSLDTGYIRRNTHGTGHWDGMVDDTFIMNIYGENHLLLPVDGDPDGVSTTYDYHTADESFWLVRRYTGMDRDGYWTDVSYWKAFSPTGEVFTFGKRSQYLAWGYDGTLAPSLETWQWSLTSQKNIYGQELTFTYKSQVHCKENPNGYAGCMQTAVYPDTITYPGGQYRIRFETPVQSEPNRGDYDPAWASKSVIVLFQLLRLNNIIVEHKVGGSYQQIRKYQFNMTYDENTIYPTITWPTGHKTLTLTQVVEYGQSSPLPATTFTYGDGMHLTRVENGYGGKVEYAYEATPWHPEDGPKHYLDDYTALERFGENRSREYISDTIQSPVMKPGGFYLMKAQVEGFSTSMWYQQGVQIYDDVYTYGDVEPLGKGWQTIYSYIYYPVDADASRKIRLNCDYCSVSDFEWIPLLTRYRVIEKRIYDGQHPQPEVFSFSYEGAAANDAEHSEDANQPPGYRYVGQYSEFRGHEQVTEIAPDGRKTINFYFQDDILQGMIYQSELHDATDFLLTKNLFFYSSEERPMRSHASSLYPHNVGSGVAYEGFNITWARLDEKESWSYQGETIALKNEYEYNMDDQGYAQYGNPTMVIDSSLQGESFIPYRMTHTRYFPGWHEVVNGVTQYLVGLPGVQRTYACPEGDCNASNENLIAESLFYYDNHAGVEDPPYQGILTSSRSLLRFAGEGYTDPRYQDTLYSYDDWGNLTSQTQFTGEGTEGVFASSGGQTTTTTYDPIFHTYPASQTNPLWTQPAYSWEFDPSFGVPVLETDANGQTTSATYDSFGRMTAIIRPGDSPQSPTISIIYHDESPYWIEIIQKDGIQLRKFYDGLGRLIQTQTVGAEVNGEIKDILVNSEYDAFGNLVRKSVPYAVTPGSGYRAPDWEQPYNYTEYDAFNRPVLVQAPDGLQTITSYTSLTTSVTDALQRTTLSTRDRRGRTVQIQPPDGPDIHYVYDEADRLIEVQTGGGITTIAYDLAGRKTGMNDMDMGSWNYTYDALGNLTSQSDARGCTTTLTYDALNRLTEKTYADCPFTSGASYTYDQGFYGARTGMSDGSGTTSWSYDARGRLTQEIKTIPGAGTFRTQWGYNSADQPAWMRYPGGDIGQVGERVDYSYLPQMVLDSVSGLQSYLSSSQADAAGRTTLRQMNSGALQSRFEYYPWAADYAWGNTNGRLAAIQSGTSADPNALQDLAYFYDPVGNITTIEDWRSGLPQTQQFSYDALDRLTMAAVSGGINGTYSEEYTYDALTGNLAEKNGAVYDYSDAGHLHAVTGIDSVALFNYDANGNMTGHNGDTLIYDAENRMTSAEKGEGGSIHYIYDGDGKLAEKIENGDRTIFLGNILEIFLPDEPLPQPTATFPSSPTPSTTFTRTPSRSPLPTRTRTITPTPSATASETLTPTETPINSPTATLTPTLTNTETVNPSFTKTSTRTPLPTYTRTGTKTRTSTWTRTPSKTPTRTGTLPSPTYTRTITGTSTKTATRTATHTRTPTWTATHTYTFTPSNTPTPSDTPTPTITPSVPEGESWKFYYYAGNTRIAMRLKNLYGETVYYFFSDHLGSTNIITDENGNVASEMMYKAWGEIRYSSGSSPTDFTYTGQRSEMDDIGLMFYNARWYDPELGRFAQADTTIPGNNNPLAWDRYSYTANNPIKFSDPSGHCWGFASGMQDWPVYGTVCDNLDMAWSIVTNSNSTIDERMKASTYIVGEGGAHLAIAAGTVMLTYSAIIPTIKAALSIGTTVETANKICNGDLCASEIADAEKAAQKLVEVGLESPEAPQLIGKLVNYSTHNPNSQIVSLGRVPEYINAGIEKGLTYFNMPGNTFTILKNAGSDFVISINQQFISNQINLSKDFAFSLGSKGEFGFYSQLEYTLISASDKYVPIIEKGFDIYLKYWRK